MLCFLYLAHLFVSAIATGETCQTPTGQRGECVPLASCQSLLWSFSNPKDDGMVNYLDKFLCSDNMDKGIIVCCRIATDILVFEDEEDNWDPNSINNIQKLVNPQNCGVQSGYVQGDGLIGLYDFPWLAKIVIKNNNLDKKDRIDKIGCTGVLINQRYILYTAQCHKTVLQQEPHFFVRIDSYTGYGSNCNSTSSSYHKSCSTFSTYEIEYYVIHPFYDPLTKLNDIAIMRLSRRVPFSEFMHPVCLPLLPELSLQSMVHISGWNRTYFRTDFSIKSTYISTSIKNCECNALNTQGHVLTTYDMCTVNGTPPDNEVIGYPITRFYKNQWYIVGFTSRGKEPRINTKVQNYLQWIKQSMGGERCLTPFNETGECIQLTDCPRLMDALANADPGDEKYFNEFVCEYADDDKNEFTYTLKVCCGNSSNFTIFLNDTEEEPDFYYTSNLRICGLQHRDDYLSTNDKVSVDEFPWLAAIINGTLPSQRDGICGGTLINHRYVLTSVQCTSTFGTNDTVLVRLGDYNLKSDIDCFQLPEFAAFECADVQEYVAENIIEHPFFNRFQLINDISLIRLNKGVKFTDYVRPICLPKSEDELSHYGTTFYTTGFGDSERGVGGPKIKKKIPTTLIPLEVCNEKVKLLSFANPETNYKICTEDFKNSTDVTCIGDEGGPVMYSKKFQWFIEGISSTFGCRDDEPQTHLSVYKYLKWITVNMKDD